MWIANITRSLLSNEKYLRIIAWFLWNRICQLIILEQKYRMIKNKINNNTVVLSYHLIAKSYWQGKSVMPLISFEKHKCNYSEKKQIQWRAGVYDWAATRVCNGVIFFFFLHFQRLKQYFKFDNPRHHNISSNTDTTETVMDR